MKIGIISDHRGYKTKMEIIKHFKNTDHIIKDYGTKSKEVTDYPKYAFILANKINEKDVEIGIAICGSGIGMSIACNKVRDIRCAHVHNYKEAELARFHNDANVIALSSKIPIFKIKKILKKFINTDFSDEKRHHKRIQMISDYEKKEKI
ncbi:MAG: RpiB/LacA/LacB family sugar-phosphate isomerase [Tenericutes bacterium]|jgi:ribose 5-phosphate isomerase B|nr:RpiB/LacA/LacB family sugar-phosphate isomerase [Mycoplasmatota bacterium]